MINVSTQRNAGSGAPSGYSDRFDAMSSDWRNALRRPDAATILFDAEQDLPEVFQKICHRCPAIRSAAESLRKDGIPMVNGACAEVMGHFYRLPAHYRSVCYAMAPSSALFDSDTLMFKGTEPLLPDIAEYLAWMMRAPFRDAELPLGLFLPLVLKMPPGAFALEECKRELALSSSLHADFLAAHGELARMPVPLFVFEVSKSAAKEYVNELHRLLTPQALERIAWRLEGGLGIAVSFYPGAPVRVGDLVDRNVRDAVGLCGDASRVSEVISRWITLFARLVALNYLPFVPWNNGFGSCFDYGNACVDGGCTDLATLTPAVSVPDVSTLRACVLSSLDILANTITSFCDIVMKRKTDQSMRKRTLFSVREQVRTRLLEALDRGEKVASAIAESFEDDDISHLITCDPMIESVRRPYGGRPWTLQG